MQVYTNVFLDYFVERVDYVGNYTTSSDEISSIKQSLSNIKLIREFDQIDLEVCDLIHCHGPFINFITIPALIRQTNTIQFT